MEILGFLWVLMGIYGYLFMEIRVYLFRLVLYIDSNRSDHPCMGPDIPQEVITLRIKNLNPSHKICNNEPTPACILQTLHSQQRKVLLIGKHFLLFLDALYIGG